jgi:hypothetical protein
VRYRSESLELPIYYGYRVGVFPGSGWLGIEREFIHLKVITDTSRAAMTKAVIHGIAVSELRPLRTCWSVSPSLTASTWCC